MPGPASPSAARLRPSPVAVPILLVTGALGAGKTTALNHILTGSHGRRLAVLVNDFGAIDIDAGLLAGVAEGVVSLKNGCICCSLQGDLLRALSTVLRREPPPDGIVIETSGVSDPAQVVGALLDPVIFREAALDAVLCLVDARLVLDEPAGAADALFRAQLRAADFLVLNKTDLLDAPELARAEARLAALRPGTAIHPVQRGAIPAELLFSAALHRPGSRLMAGEPVSAEFESAEWTAAGPLSLPAFQAVMGRFAPALVRAKGVLRFTADPAQPLLFQLAGHRATITPAPPVPWPEPVQLVFIARRGALDRAALLAALARCAPSGRC